MGHLEVRLLHPGRPSHEARIGTSVALNLSILRAAGENAFVIGSIAKATGDEHQVELQGL